MSEAGQQRLMALTATGVAIHAIGVMALIGIAICVLGIWGLLMAYMGAGWAGGWLVHQVFPGFDPQWGMVSVLFYLACWGGLVDLYHWIQRQRH